MSTKKAVVKVKRAYNRKKSPVTAESSKELFLKALSEYYSGDRLSPGFHVAWMPEKKMWYAVVKRFPNDAIRTFSERVVVFQTEESLNQAVLGLMKKWKEKIVEPKKDNLERFLA